MKRFKQTRLLAHKLNFKTLRILLSAFHLSECSIIVKFPIARSTATRLRLTRTDLILQVRDLQTWKPLACTITKTPVRQCASQTTTLLTVLLDYGFVITSVFFAPFRSFASQFASCPVDTASLFLFSEARSGSRHKR